MAAAPLPSSALRGGRNYPRSYAELLAWFPDDDACRDYLDWLRWPDDFVCPRCDEEAGHRLATREWWCGACDYRTTVTAGTIFHRTRTPLTVWFASAWFMTSTKTGVSAKSLHRLLGFGSYQTAWTMLHRYRSAMVRPGRDRLGGTVEVDETFIGGVKPGKRGRGAAGKTMVAVAVEQAAHGFGRCRLEVIPRVTAPILGSFLQRNIDFRSVLLTDGHKSYPPAIGNFYVHKPFVVAGSGVHAHVPLPGVHRVASLVKRWLLGTHQGAVEGDHLQAYLDEFTFRFNRRHSRARGLLFRRLLEQAVETPPRTYTSFVVHPTPKMTKPVPPTLPKRSRPPSLALDVPDRPWRR